MKILKPGDPCPCCGEPIKEGVPMDTLLLLSWVADGLALTEALKNYKKNKVITDAE